MSNAVTALALSAGDPSGIGPEIAIAAFMAREAAALPPFYLLADPALIASRARLLGISLPVVETTSAQAAQVFARALPIVPLTTRCID
ncbi:4-hydroxythreonine-4-phosphate dehydrogenase, partial [Mesorhizobium sp. M7A.T.Ca.US.000.02.1.1]